MSRARIQALAEKPAHTDARGRHWEIWLKVAPQGPRRRVTTWIPVRRNQTDNALLGGREAKAIHDVLERLWTSLPPRYDVVAALCDGRLALPETYLTLLESGLAGVSDAFAMLARDRDDLSSMSAQAPAATKGAAAAPPSRGGADDPADPDLLPFVEDWDNSPLERQDGKGSITAATRSQQISRVLGLLSPEWRAWRVVRSLALRDKRAVPDRPAFTPFRASQFSTAAISAFLKASYEVAPTEKEQREINSSDPKIGAQVRETLRGQGDGAVATFDAFKIFSRQLLIAGVLKRDPTAAMHRPRYGQPRWYKLTSQADVELFASRLPAPYGDAFRMMCGTGLEPSPTLAALVADIDRDTESIIGRGTKTKSRERRAETGTSAWAASLRLMAEAEKMGRLTLFPARDALDGKVTLHRMDKIFARVRDELRAEGLKQFEGIVPYSGRHTYCVMTLKGGATYAEVAHQLGHINAKMVIKTYSLHIPKAGTLRDAIRRTEASTQ